MKRFLTLVMVSIAACSGLATAQQPGSQQYNSVFLPAHGADDTVSGAGWESRWGAMAISPTNSWTGWAVNRPSKEIAANEAMQMCAARGGVDCIIDFSFHDSCGAVATNGFKGQAGSDRSLRIVRRETLKACGRDCRILWEGCSFAVRVK